MESDEELEVKIAGLYLWDYKYYVVSVKDGMVSAVDDSGKKVPVGPVTWEGRKVED